MNRINKMENTTQDPKPKFMDRLISEESELGDKLIKLSTFISDEEKFKSIDKEQQALLRIQQQAMHTYAQCLNQRIIHLQDKMGIKHYRV